VFNFTPIQSGLTSVKNSGHNNYVIRKLILNFLAVILLAGIFPGSVFAVTIPPTAEGPGFILPDSPLYFLDHIKQNVRVALAFKPQDRARVYNSIAGERLAELRFMLARDDKDGIKIALDGVSENTRKAAESLYDAQFVGENVEKLAESLNNDINRKQDSLAVLLEDGDEDLKTMVLGVNDSIFQSKSKVSGGLPSHLSQNEKKNDVLKQIETKVKYDSGSLKSTITQIEALKKQASESGQKSINQKAAELNRLKGFKNITEIRKKQAELAGDTAKVQAIQAAYQKLIDAAKKYEDAKTAYLTAQQELKQLLNQKPQVTPTAAP
jgi:hypothetical protein